MKTFDEYIQGRILKAYNDAPGEGFCNNFNELALAFKYDRIDYATGFMQQRYGIGKQRAKDYAHYIVAYLEEQNEPLYTSAVAYADEPAIEKSHLTDEDAEKIYNLIVEMINAYSMQHQDDTATNLINFINSLKGE